MTMNRRRFTRSLGAVSAAAAMALLATPVVHAQPAPFPAHSIRLVVNFAAGGTTDIIARAMAKPLEQALGQPVVIENRTGALGAIGAAEVARATPDGHTILLTTQGSLTETPVLTPNTPYNPLTAFAPVTLIGDSPLLLIAHPDFPANDVKGLIEYAKTQPQGIDMAVTGSSVKLGAYALAGAAGIKIVQIPYSGQGPALTALLGGQTPLALNASSTTLIQQVQAGKLKLLGVGTEGIYSLMPKVPPISRTLPGFVSKAWWGIFAPAGTPPEAIAKLNAAFRKALATPGMEPLFLSNAVSPVASSPAELGALVSKGLEQTRALVKQYQIPLD